MSIKIGWMGAPGEGTPKGVENSDVTTYMGDCNEYMSFISETTYANYAKILDGTYTPAADTKPIITKVLSGTGIPLVAQIPKTAVDEYESSDEDYVEDIETNYGTDSNINAFYLEEPDHNGWSKTLVGNLKAEFASKPLIVNLQEDASQTEVNDYSANASYICMPSYPLAASTSEWDNIENMAATTGSENGLHKMTIASGNPDFYFVVQACDPGGQRAPIIQGSGSGSRSQELDWMTLRALLNSQTPAGIFFYSASRAKDQDTDLLYAVKNLLDDLTLSTYNFMDILDTSSQNSDVTVNSGSSDIQFQYREVSGDHYLMVMDKNPSHNASKTFTVTCDIGGQYTDFDSVLEIWSGNGVSGTKEGGTDIKFTDTISRGAAAFYRFIEI